MIRQYLSNINESATICVLQNFLELNKAIGAKTRGGLPCGRTAVSAAGATPVIGVIHRSMPRPVRCGVTSGCISDDHCGHFWATPGLTVLWQGQVWTPLPDSSPHVLTHHTLQQEKKKGGANPSKQQVGNKMDLVAVAEFTSSSLGTGLQFQTGTEVHCTALFFQSVKKKTLE